MIINIIKIFVLISLIMFIIRGIIKEAHIRTKGIVYTIVSLSLVIVFTIVFFVDRSSYQYLNNPYIYLIFIGSSFVYLVFGITTLLKSKKIALPKKKKTIYTYHPKEEYVYIIYKHRSLIYLNKEKSVGIKYKMKKTEFADEVVGKINQNLKAKTTDDIERLGTINIKGTTVDEIFYCYIIEVSDPIINDSLECVTNYDVTSLSIPDFDRFVILHLLMGKPFQEDYE